MSGSYRVWNRLLRDMRNPRPFYGVGPNTPAPLRWGQENEAQACAVWWDRHPELDLDNPVILNYHDESNGIWHRNTAVSPDRMIVDPISKKWVSGFELKCPYLQEKHFAWIQGGVCPGEHYPQCAWGMLMTGLREWVFCSFDPRLGDPTDQLFEVTVVADQAYLDDMYEKGTRLLEQYELGEDFSPPQASAKAFKEMFDV